MTDWLAKIFVKDSSNIQNPAVRSAYGNMAGWVGIFCNIVLFAGKLLIGTLSASISITADALNNLSDATSSIITLIGFKMSSKPADAEHPFGHARIEYISGLIVSVMVIVIGVELGKSSFDKIVEPTAVNYTVWTYVVLVAAILIKLWMAYFNLKLGKKIDSATLKATYADSRNDVITTSAVLLSAVIFSFSGVNLDGWMGLAVSVFILFSGIGLVKETLNPLLGQAPDPQLVQYIDEKINSYANVLGTHDLILHDYGPARRYASAHVEISSKEDVMIAHDIIDTIEKDFLEKDNIHLIIHYDPVQTDNKQVEIAHEQVKKCLSKIDSKLTFHDLRVIDGPSHMNYIFDVVLPDGFSKTSNQLQKEIEKKIQDGNKPINIVLTTDQFYTTNGR